MAAVVGLAGRGGQVDMKGRQGVVIAPSSSTDGELIGVRIPRSSMGGATQAGQVPANLGDGTLQTI